LGIKNGAALPSIAFLTLALATAETCLTEIDTGSAMTFSPAASEEVATTKGDIL